MATRATTLRRRLVHELDSRGAIRTAAVRKAFLAVPRERFLPEHAVDVVYRDDAIPTKFARNGMPISSSSQPTIMAEMLERLVLEPGMRVLEVGAGTGYNAALLTQLVGPRGRVDTIDVDADTARRARRALRSGGYRVRVLQGDGREPVAGRARYDRIIVTASSETVPHAWFEQLVDGGIVVLPLRLRETAGAHVVAALRKDARGFRSASVVAGGFMPLRGEGDDALPSAMRALQATDLTTEPARMLRQVAGAGLARMSATARRRLLAVALEPPQKRPLGFTAAADALVLFLATTLRGRDAIAVMPEYGVGLAARDGSGLAYVVGRFSSVRRITSITTHGADGPCRKLELAIRKWDERGRPGLDALAIAVSYDGEQPVLRHRWSAAH